METITAKQIHDEFKKDALMELSNEEYAILQGIGYIHLPPCELQLKFPCHKIIHDSRVVKLCEKYGMACGRIIRFVDFIPTKNIKELAQFEKQYQYFNFYEEQRGFMGFLKDSIRHSMERIDGYAKISYPNKCFSYMIIAPSDMIVTDKQIQATIGIIKDPIILASLTVESGFNGWNVIVTAWGDEASDEMIVNPDNN